MKKKISTKPPKPSISALLQEKKAPNEKSKYSSYHDLEKENHNIKPLNKTTPKRYENILSKNEVFQLGAINKKKHPFNKEKDEQNELYQTISELRKLVSSLNSQLEATLAEKNAISRHFWNLKEDFKEQNQQNHTIVEEKETLNDKLNEVQFQLSNIQTISQSKEKNLQQLCENEKEHYTQMKQMSSDFNDAIEQAENQNEQLKCQYEERVGGLQEVVELQRTELVSLEVESSTMIKTMNEQILDFDEKNKNIIADKLKIIAERDEVLNKMSDLCSDIKKSKELNTKLSSKLSKQEQTIRSIENKYRSEIELLESKYRSSNEDVQKMQENINDFSRNEKDNLVTIKDLDSELDHLKNLCKGLQKELEIRVRELYSVQTKLEKVDRTFHEAKSNLIQVSEEYKDREKVWERQEKIVISEKNKFECLQMTKQNSEAANRRLESCLSEKDEMIEKLKSDVEEKVKNMRDNFKELQTEKMNLSRNFYTKLDEKERNLLGSKALAKAESRKIKDVEKLIDDSKNTVEALKSQIKTLNDSREIIQIEKEELKSQVKNVNDSREVIELENTEMAHKCESQKQTHREELSILNRKIQEYENEKRISFDEYKKSRKLVDTALIEMNKLKNENSILQEEINALDEFIRLLKKKEQLMNDEITNTKNSESCIKSKLEETSQLLIDDRDNRENASKIIRKEKEACFSEINLLKKELASHPKEKEDLLSEINHSKKELASHQESSNKQFDEISVQLKVAKEALQREKKKLIHDCESLKSKLLEAEDDTEASTLKHKSIVKEMRQEMERLEIKSQNLQSESDQLTIQLEFKSCEVERLKSCLRTTQENLVEVETKLNSTKRNDISTSQRPSKVQNVLEISDTDHRDELTRATETESVGSEKRGEMDHNNPFQVSLKVNNNTWSTTEMIDKTKEYIINKKKKASFSEKKI